MTLKAETWRTEIVHYEVFHHDAYGWDRVHNQADPLQWHHVGYAPWTGGQWLALREWSFDTDAQSATHADLGDPSPELHAKHRAAFAAVRPDLVALLPSPDAPPPPSLALLRDAPPGPWLSPWLFTTRAAGELDLLAARANQGATLLQWAPGASEPRRVRCCCAAVRSTPRCTSRTNSRWRSGMRDRVLAAL